MKNIFDIDYRVREKWKSKVELLVYNEVYTSTLEKIISDNKVVVRNKRQGEIMLGNRIEGTYEIYDFSMKEWDKIRCHFFTDELSQRRNKRIETILK